MKGSVASGIQKYLGQSDNLYAQLIDWTSTDYNTILNEINIVLSNIDATLGITRTNN